VAEPVNGVAASGAARLVPTIDISASRDRAAVGAELDAACREVGFFEVVGHGVPAASCAATSRAVPARLQKQRKSSPRCRRMSIGAA
jgi:hypothetical protein